MKSPGNSWMPGAVQPSVSLMHLETRLSCALQNWSQMGWSLRGVKLDSRTHWSRMYWIFSRVTRLRKELSLSEMGNCYYKRNQLPNASPIISSLVRFDHSIQPLNGYKKATFFWEKLASLLRFKGLIEGLIEVRSNLLWVNLCFLYVIIKINCNCFIGVR